MQKSNLQLRDYQVNAIKSIEECFAKGQNKLAIVLATGLGKTVIFDSLAVDFVHKTGKQVLILAHREELLTQAKEKLLRIDPTLDVQIEMANQEADPKCDVVIASVATLGRSGSKRIEKFDAYNFCMIVIDEAHHASASTYKNILAYFGVLKNPVLDCSLCGGKGTIRNDRPIEIQVCSECPNNIGYLAIPTDGNKDCLLLGVTATPSRNDNQGIDKIFDEVVFNYGILEGIRDGWLSRIKAYRVDTTTSLENVHTLAGDFKQDELADAINNPERNNLVVKTYQEQFKDKQALIFAIDVAHALALQEAFYKKEILNAVITGTTDKEARKIALEKFHNKEIPVVINCMVLTEGYDNDTIDVVMMARPTKSGILYQQMIGRGTRTHHAKPWLTICDFVDNTYKHTIKTSASLLGIEGMINFRGGDLLESLEKIEEIRELNPDFNFNRLDFNKLDYVMEEVDLMGGLDVPLPLKGITDYSWTRFGEDAYRISLGNDKYIVAKQTITGQWKATEEYWNKLDKYMEQISLGEEQTLEQLIPRVDTYIQNNFYDSLRLVNMKADWRKDKPSEKQVEALKRLGVHQDIIDQLDKGKASQLQNKLYASLAKKANKPKSYWYK